MDGYTFSTPAQVGWCYKLYFSSRKNRSGGFLAESNLDMIKRNTYFGVYPTTRTAVRHQHQLEIILASTYPGARVVFNIPAGLQTHNLRGCNQIPRDAYAVSPLCNCNCRRALYYSPYVYTCTTVAPVVQLVIHITF